MVVFGHGGGRHGCLAKGGPDSYRTIGTTRGKTAFLLALAPRVSSRGWISDSSMRHRNVGELGGTFEAVADGVRKI